MSQRTFTSSIYVKLGGQAAQNEDHTIQRVELDIDPVTKTIVREKKHSKAPHEQGNPPEFIIKPRRQFVNEGQSAKFKASYEGSPSTVLTWSKDGSVLHASRKNKVYQDEKEIHILEVSNVTEEDGGIYTCTIRNSAGATETTAELEVYSKPRKFTPKKTYVAPSVDLPLQDKQVSPGDKRVVLECKFSNAIDAVTCWYKDRQPLKKSLSARQIFDGWLSKLTLTTVTEDHNGLYECSASNNGGEVRTCCRVSVMAPGTRSIPPKFINPLSDQVLSAGGKLVLESKVTGYPRPSIRWYKNQQEIKSSRASKTEFDGSTVRLIIKNMEVSDTDSYKCIAENDVGIDQIKAKVTVQREVIKKSDSGIDIIRQSSVQPVPSLAEELPRKQPVNHTSPVRPQLLSDQLRTFKSSDPGTQPLSPTKENREPPIFLKELQDIDVTEGDPVELKIEVKGTPPIEIVWVHNNSEVNGDHPIYKTTCSDNIQQLVIPKCKMEDSGEFVCEAYNEYGEIDTFCRMNVNENKPDVKVKEIEPLMSPQTYNKVSSNVPHSKETPPDFILKPHSSVVLEGNSAIFLCRPQGNPHPSVQWLKQGNVIENNQKYQLTHGDDSILEIKDISEMDCGKYTCLLLNSAGSLSTEIELSILGTSPKNTSLSPESPIRKRSTPQSLKRGGINRKIEMFEKPETSSPTLKSPTTNFTLNRTPNKYSSPSEGKMQNIRGQTRSQNKSEDFRDVLNRIKPSAEKSHENRSPGINRQRNSPLSQISPSGLVSRRQRDKSPVKVSEAIRKFSEVSKHQSDEDKFVNTGSHRSIKFGKISESPKRFQENERSRSNIRKIANELAESPKTSNKLEIDKTVSNITKIANEVVVSPKILNKLEWDDTDLVKTDLSVKERQAAIHGDLKTIIGKKQNMILQEELTTGPQTQNVKTLSSPDSENKLKKNFLTEVSQPNSLEMEAVFGQKFEPSKISTTSEKPKKRASVIERSDSGPNEFQKMLQRKRNSLPSSQSPVKLQRPSSFRERSSAQKQNDMSPILRTNVRRVNNINEVLDGLKDKPPKGDVINKPTVSLGIVPKSSERQNRSRNTGETRRLSRESSPHFRNMLNQIEERGKNEQNDRVPNKSDEKISNSPARSSVNSPLSDRTKRPENSSVQDRVSLPQRTKIEFSPSSNKENSRKESSEFSDSSDNTEHRVVEDKLEKKRIQRVQKWDELSKLYSSPDSTVQSPSINLERKQNGWSDTKHQSNESYHNKSPYEGQLNDTSENYEQTENISSSANVKDSENDAFNNEYQAVNGSIYENEFPESTGHAVMMNLKRTKLSEVEELFEDFSRIDREFESLKRNPKYGPLETLDVDDADKEILSKIPVLSSNFSEDSSSSPLEAPRSDIVKKTKYSKKFNFEKSPASVEQQDFRHVLKRHVEPHHRQHPKFLVDLADVKVSEGQPVTLECKVSGIPKPEVAWSMNNKRIKKLIQIEPSKFFRMPYEDNTAKLKIAGAYPEDDGEYVCSATNSLGTARCSCHLYVEECSNPSNEVTDEEGPSDMSSNQLSTFSSQSDSPLRKVSYSSTDTPTNIPTFDHHTNTVPRQLDQATPNTPSVSTSLDESYIDDNEFEDDFQNVKKEAPRIHEISPKNVVVERRQKLQLQMSFTAEPKPVIRWYRDNFEIISNKFYTINTTEHFSRLIIDQVDGGDGGKYNVVVENELGSDSVGTTVAVLDVPSQPSKPYATETTLFTIILSWEQPTFDGGSPVKKFKVEVCNAEEESWDTLTEECSSTSYCATNLAAHNPFFFRVSAKNKIGFSQPSLTSDVIVTKDNHPSRRLSVDSDEEELPFSPRTVVPVTEKKFEDHYENIEEVGKGKFGNVYKCFHKEDKKTWAAKVIKCRKKEERNNVKNEVSIMNELTHPKLLMLRDAYETPRSMVLVMEYIGGGELFDRVADEDLELTERDCVHFMRQICEGVRYMHEKSIMHLDLKPENILCVRKDSNLIKIIDFGLARRSTPGESLKVMFGTPEFIAPEVVNYDQIGLPTDIWSLGVICYVLLSGLSPFMGDNDSETLSNVTQGEFDFDDEAFDEISHDARSFIEKCLSKNMRKRLTVSQCIEHKWLIHSERNSSKKLRQSLRNLKQFMARRKWQKMGTAIRAIGRMSNWQKQRGDSKSHDNSSINSDSDIASQSDLSIQPSSRSPSHARTDSREDDHHTSDTTETDEEVFTNTKEKNCEDDRCENCENNNKHYKTITDSSAPAEIVKDMVDCEAVKGDIVRFDLVVEGTPTPNVKWFHGKKIIHEDHRHSFSCKNGLCSLIVRDICESDEGEYTCKVANDLGQDSCSAELIVYGVNAF